MVQRGVWFALLFTVAVSDVVNPVSYLWPMPQSVHCYSDQVYTLTEAFAFQGTGHGGNLPALMAAFERYRQFITPSTVFKTPTSTLTVSANVTTLETLVVEVSSADDTLDLETDESCEPHVLLSALRGLTTFLCPSVSRNMEGKVVGLRIYSSFSIIILVEFNTALIYR